MSGTLFIVATPIGNMQDMSLRAVKTLLTADVIACEDTRRAGILLEKIRELVPGFPATNHSRFVSYYDQVEKQKALEIISFLKKGMNVALISDAGTPLVSDPGYRVVTEAIAQGIPIVCVPGASSVLAALTVSGLPSDKFFFLGFLPKKEGHRKELLNSLKTLKGQLKTTIIFFEAPHRVMGTLDELQETFGSEKYFVIARELTKVYEEILRGTVAEIKEHFKKKEPKGEFVILFSTED